MEELLKQPLKLYRDSLRLAAYLAAKQGVPAAGIRDQVRAAFRRNAGETDPTKIKQQRERAVQGLHTYLMHEAQLMARKGEEPFEKE